jgi:23S rRNA pseudouridine1911/1915/1917 synthase
LKNVIVVSPEYEDERIDHYLTLIHPDFTRSYLQKLIKSGEVLVNGRAVKASYRVQEEDLVEVHIPEAITPDILPENIPLEILYEDEDVILVNKPKGMVVHPAAGHLGGTLVNALMYHCGESLSGINGVMRPGIVHRIDKDTTGVLIACKNDFAHQSIAAQLKEHSITRRYYALVCGNIKEDEGTVEGPIGRHPTDRKRMAINYQHGKEAVTHYRVLERFGAYTWIECRLETGRTHQIRVHMASIGHPLLGDGVYGGETRKSLTGQCLHAYVLGFVHPRTGEYMEFQAALPAYFERLLDSMRR